MRTSSHERPGEESEGEPSGYRLFGVARVAGEPDEQGLVPVVFSVEDTQYVVGVPASDLVGVGDTAPGAFLSVNYDITARTADQVLPSQFGGMPRVGDDETLDSIFGETE